jgi:hypothetical protein
MAKNSKSESYVVKCDDLAFLFDTWVKQVSTFCGDPSTSTDPTGIITISWHKPYTPRARHRNDLVTPKACPSFQYKDGLLDTLVMPQWRRVMWYYYCDDDYGNTIRLYDWEHFHHYKQVSAFHSHS